MDPYGMPLPSQRSRTHIEAFYSRYPSFHYDPYLPLVEQFRMLCNHFGWEKRDRKRHEAHEQLKEAMVLQFQHMYGKHVDDIKAWRSLCQILRISPIPRGLDACRRAVKAVHVNIVDLTEVGMDVESVNSLKIFETERELRTYTCNTEKFFPLSHAKAGSLLKYLLRHILVESDEDEDEDEDEYGFHDGSYNPQMRPPNPPERPNPQPQTRKRPYSSVDVASDDAHTSAAEPPQKVPKPRKYASKLSVFTSQAPPSRPTAATTSNAPTTPVPGIKTLPPKTTSLSTSTVQRPQARPKAAKLVGKNSSASSAISQQPGVTNQRSPMTAKAGKENSVRQAAFTFTSNVKSEPPPTQNHMPSPTLSDESTDYDDLLPAFKSEPSSQSSISSIPRARTPDYYLKSSLSQTTVPFPSARKVENCPPPLSQWPLPSSRGVKKCQCHPPSP
ncbi:hypothetical protein BXZ70DRAFT_766307 [Cristinia sonorae]|uniref:Uncharacterized protein n=1 Tax=Cristinia sonorae TaxID=1940300 RepID=A0A8K0UTF9_9AGAR|nr:hypothetical protein BXZ70DRAFT_766307 [Cristinia sonorae]